MTALPPRRLPAALLAAGLALALAPGVQSQSLPDIGSSAGQLLTPAQQQEYGEMTLAQLRNMAARADGQSPASTLRRIHERAAELVDAQYRCWNEDLRPELAGHGIRLLQPGEWNAEQREWLRAHFRDEIMDRF